MADRFRFRNEMPAPGTRASVLNVLPIESAVDGEAVLRLYDPIDDWGGDWGVSAKEFATALAALPEDTHTIKLHINSPGGMVFEGIAIMNQLRAHSAKVVAVVDGLAASAASFIAASADEVIMGPQSQMMIHDALGLTIGNAAEVSKFADLLDRISNTVASVYAAKSGGTTEDWRTAMLAESWYSAQEAVDAGLADSVAGEPPADPPAKSKAKDSFDTSDWKYSSRDEAPAPMIATKGGFPSRIDSHEQGVRKFHGLD